MIMCYYLLHIMKKNMSSIYLYNKILLLLLLQYLYSEYKNTFLL